jgi:hypothetical protein
VTIAMREDQEITTSSSSLLRQGQPYRSRQEFAGLQSGCVKMSGFMARRIWVLICIQFLAEDSLRFSVFFQWAWHVPQCKARLS